MTRIIIDVREPFEYMMGHIKGAINLPGSKLMAGTPKQLADTPKDTELVLYCASGARCGVAKNILEQQGFTNVVNGVNKAQVQAKYL